MGLVALMVERWNVDKFDRAEAAFWWLNDHHKGQWSPEYRKLCAVAAIFNPSPLSHGPDSEESKALYQERCERAGCSHD